MKSILFAFILALLFCNPTHSQPAPEPAPVPEPSPAPSPAPLAPVPEPSPSPVPEPSPAPSPAPLAPVPEPSPAAPVPEPAPAPHHVPEPSPAPHHVPEPEPQPAPLPQVQNFIFQAFPTYPAAGHRSGSILAVSGPGDGFDVLSGLGLNNEASNTSWSFNASMNSWAQFNINFTRIGACYSQANSSSNGLSQIAWIFGGRNNTGDPFVNEVIIYNTTTKTLQTISQDNTTAGPLGEGAACSAAPDDSVMYVFGGRQTVSICSQDIYSFSYANHEWALLNVSNPVDAPPPSEGSTAIVYGNFVVIYGGGCGAVHNYNVVYRFNISGKTWSRDPVQQNGTTPSPRMNHVAILSTNEMIVYGGVDVSGNVLSDLWSYNLDTNTWTFINITGPEARSQPSAGIFFNRIYLYGGKSVTTTFNDTWQLVLEKSCLGLTCDVCTQATNCGWCNSNPENFQCIAGNASSAFIGNSCTSTSPNSFSTDVLDCPEIGFPSWAIALIVIGGVVLIGITVFAIMKIREKPEYQEIR